VATPARPRRVLGFWLGTRPGLERLLLASVPALVVGVFVAGRTRWYVGYLVAFAIMTAAVFVRRRSKDSTAS